MLKNNTRLDGQVIQNEADTLHAAVLVQDGINAVATECFGRKPSNPKNTFPSNEW